jgi:hypothetical protein
MRGQIPLRYLCHICHGPVSLSLYTNVVTDENGKTIHESCMVKRLSTGVGNAPFNPETTRREMETVSKKADI